MQIRIDKASGSDEYQVRIRADNIGEAIQGMAEAVRELAAATNTNVESILAKLAVVILAGVSNKE